MIRSAPLLLAWAALIACGQANAQKRALTVEDYAAIQDINDPRISPDGRQIVFVVTTPSGTNTRKIANLWTVAGDGKTPPRALTRTAQSSNHPRWNPGGKSIAFLSARPSPKDGTIGKAQVQILDLGGGEAYSVTRFKNGVSDFQWSPDGTKLVVVTATGPADEADAAADGRSDIRHYAHAGYKADGRELIDGRRDHLWIVDVASGAANQITFGDQPDTEPSWSPDGMRIAFVSDRSGHLDDERQTETANGIFVVPATGGTAIKVSGHDRLDEVPHWSPKGDRIAYLGALDEEHAKKIWIASADGSGKEQPAVPDIDPLTNDFRWAGNKFYWAAGTRGNQHIFSADVDGGAAADLTPNDRHLALLDIAPSAGMAVYASGDFRHPREIYAAKLSFEKGKALTHLNQALLDQVELGSLSRIAFKGRDGLPIEGFLVKPYGFQPNRRYPMVLMIHGGPNGMFGDVWNFQSQLLAAQGWAVLYTNPRGSSGYGHEFQRAVALEWGGKAYDDIMAGVDAVLAENPWIDPGRLGVWGHSYGGFMTNWIISHTTRFAAAVSLDGITNFISDDGVRDGFYGHARDFGGDFYENFDLSWKYSPIRYAAQVKTPTLIVQGEADQRVPMEQAEEWFRALRNFNVPAEMLILPREAHNGAISGETRHVMETMRWALYWYDKYLDGNADALAPDAVQKHVPQSSTRP